MKISLTKANLQTVIDQVKARGGASLNIDKVMAAPEVYATDLFRVLLIQKQLKEAAANNRCVTLVPDILSAAEAINNGMLKMAPNDDKTGIVLTMQFYIADQAVDNGAVVSDGALIVGDGEHNGTIVDPLWVNYRKAATSSSSTDGGGGCSAGWAALLTIAVAPLAVRRWRHK